MSYLKKLSSAFSDPVFYRKKLKGVARRFRKFDDTPKWQSLGAFGDVSRAVFVVAHPDDETFCSGLICQLVAAGCQVEIICLTRGEGGPPGNWPRSELGGVRAKEMKRACETLGVTKLEFLDHVDPVAGQYRVYAPDVMAKELAVQLEPFLKDADLVVSHGSGGEYWHPAHLLVFEAVSHTVKRLGAKSPRWLTFMAREPNHAIPQLINWDDEAHLRIDVSDEKVTRLEALRCHETQLNVFERFAGGDAASYFEKCSIETYSLQK